MGEKKYKILIVEDDVELLPMIAEVLEEEPEFEVAREDNGIQAAMKIADWVPDLILLDYVIPGLNGFELCKKIRADERTMHIPVLAISSLASEEHRRDIRGSGITDYLPKPFSSTALVDKVWQLLRQDSSSSA